VISARSPSFADVSVSLRPSGYLYQKEILRTPYRL
jgi:hypothetical protein